MRAALLAKGQREGERERNKDDNRVRRGSVLKFFGQVTLLVTSCQKSVTQKIGRHGVKENGHICQGLGPVLNTSDPLASMLVVLCSLVPSFIVTEEAGP